MWGTYTQAFIGVCLLLITPQIGCVEEEESDKGNRGAKFVAVADNSIKHVYFDGVNQGGSVGWHKAFVAQLHDDVQVIAIEGHDSGGLYGIAALTEYGEVTDHTWKCTSKLEANWFEPDFDDSHWPPAMEIGQYGMAPWGGNADHKPTGSKWIWHRDGAHTSAYCRKTRDFDNLGGKCDCDENPNCATCGTKLVAVVDNSIKHVYYDGMNQGGSVGWHRAFVSQLKDNIQVIAIEAIDTGGHYGIAASTEYGEITDHTWKCISKHVKNWFQPDFDDSQWPQAMEVGPYGMTPWGDGADHKPIGSKWIWHRDGARTTAYCRKTRDLDSIGECDCKANPDCASCGAKFVAVVDNSIKRVFFNGINQGGSTGWHRAYVATLKDNIHSIAVEAVDTGGLYGIAALTEYGEITDSSWKCIPDQETNWFRPDFDDSHWPHAIEIGLYGMAPWGAGADYKPTGSKWIWHRHGAHTTAYCRKTRDLDNLGSLGSIGAQCHCSGDPHCMSFDGKKLDYYGACRYTAVQDGCVDGVYQGDSTFKVVLDFHKLNPRHGVTYTKSVHVEIAGHGTVSLLQDNKVAVNGLNIDSFPAGPFAGVTVRKSHDTVSVTLKNLVQVFWSQRRWLFTVYVPGNLRGKVCGMCGNFNGDAADDWMMGDGWKCPAMATPGDVTDNSNKFGGSWLDGLDSDAGCTAPKCDKMDEPPPECSPADELAAKKHCHELFNTNGRFKTCLAKISKEDLDNLVHDCEFDTCMVGDPDNELLCNQAENLVELCKTSYKVKVTGWRDNNFCQFECPENMVYKDCGSIYQPSCSDRKGSTEGHCMEGCFCASGFVADGDKCILPEECGCTMNGVMYKLGTSILTNDCTQQCTCTKDDEQMVCVPSDCAKNSMCTVQNYERVCVCPPTHVGSGRVCFPKEAICAGQGDPHYISFDNKRFDFMGACQYVLARDGCQHGVPNSEPSFKLVGDLYKRHPTHPVTYTKALYLYVKSPGEKKISLLRENEVKINAVKVNHFPVHLSSGVTINKELDTITVTLPNKVIIKWVANKWLFSVKVTSDHLGETCGLCGNFNDDQDDDWTMGAATCERRDDLEMGAVAPTARLFGISWLDATDDDFTCSEECNHLDDPDPTCSPTERAAASKHCSPLSDNNGRFKDCLFVMDIRDLEGIVSDCEFDTCITDDDDNSVLCGMAGKLVEVCAQKYGIQISEWRDITFCPLACEANMEFKDCGSACPATCDDPDASSECAEPCREGCFCMEGYVADGAECIKQEDCGCTKDGVLYQVEESVLNTECSELCTCNKHKSAMECEPSGCHVKSICAVIDGSRGCQCPDTHSGDGKTCELIAPESVPDKKDFPCEASPAHCVVKRRSKCVAVRKGQICGVGQMTEIRHCYKDQFHTGNHKRHSVIRKCCLGRCDVKLGENTQGIPGGPEAPMGVDGMSPGVGIEGPDDDVITNGSTGTNSSLPLNVVRCKDVFPDCEDL